MSMSCACSTNLEHEVIALCSAHEEVVRRRERYLAKDVEKREESWRALVDSIKRERNELAWELLGRAKTREQVEAQATLDGGDGAAVVRS